MPRTALQLIKGRSDTGRETGAVMITPAMLKD